MKILYRVWVAETQVSSGEVEAKQNFWEKPITTLVHYLKRKYGTWAEIQLTIKPEEKE